MKIVSLSISCPRRIDFCCGQMSEAFIGRDVNINRIAYEGTESYGQRYITVEYHGVTISFCPFCGAEIKTGLVPPAGTPEM